MSRHFRHDLINTRDEQVGEVIKGPGATISFASDIPVRGLWLNLVAEIQII